MSPQLQLIDRRLWDGNGQRLVRPDRDPLTTGVTRKVLTTAEMLAEWTANRFPGLHPNHPVGQITAEKDIVDVYPSSPLTPLILSSVSPIKGRRFWGIVKNPSGLDVNDAWLCGPDPDAWSSGHGEATAVNYDCLQVYGSNPPHFKLFDTTVDPTPWVTKRGRAALNPYVWGMHGSNFEAYRCLITQVQDGCNLVGPSTLSAAMNAFTIIQQCHIHTCLYANDRFPPNDGQPHCDAIQIGTGPHYKVLFSTLGGPRDPAGYLTWPKAPAGIGTDGPGYNSGHDYWNSCIICKQETSWTDGGDTTNYNNIWDVEFAYLLLGGGTSSINIANTASNGRHNPYTTLSAHHLKYLTRGADWGKTLKSDGLGQVPYQNASGQGAYAFVPDNFAGTYDSATCITLETGALAPARNGGTG